MSTSDIIEGERVPLRTKDHPLRVLIADDHAPFRDGLRRLLEDAGLKVIGQAGDGKEAVALTERLEPDLLLLDLSMPKHSGMEALQELSKNKKNGVRVIVLTAA
jgi:DNA-binding NarL/FixJ family response regulator